MRKIIFILIALLIPTLIKLALAVDFVNHPKNLRIFQGNCSSFNIDVENPTTQTLEKVSPKIKYVEFFGNFTITPSYADIPPKSRKTFKVTICANTTAIPSNYSIFLSVKANSLSYAEIINVEVVRRTEAAKNKTGKHDVQKPTKIKTTSTTPTPTKTEETNFGEKRNAAVLITLPILAFGIAILLKLNPTLISMLHQKEKISIRDLVEDPRKFEGKEIELKCELFLQKSGNIGSIFKLYDGTSELLAYYPKSFSVKIMGSGSVKGFLYIHKGKPLFSIQSIKWDYWVPKEE